MSIDLIIPFFAIFRNENLPLWLSLGIFAIGILFSLYYYACIYAPVRHSLQKVNHKLDKIAGYNQFYTSFPTLDTIFTDEGLKHSWDEFKQTLIMPTQYDEEKIIRSTIRPIKYFNFESLSNRYNISFFQSLPNIIVGIGLLLTFCGLVSAIYLTGESITQVSSDAMASHAGSLKSALDNLLKIAAFKFLTSIAGLITSILLTLEIRILNGRLRRGYNRLNTLLERNMIFENLEQQNSRQQLIGLRQLECMRRQSEIIEQFTGSFTRENARSLTRAIHSVFRFYGDRISDKTNALVNDFSQKTAEAAQSTMTQLVQEFGVLLHAETGKALQELADSLQKASAVLQDLTVSLKETGAACQNDVEAASENLALNIQAVSDTLKTKSDAQIELIESRMAESAQTLKETLADATNRFQEIGQTLEKSAGSASQAMQNNILAIEKAFATKTNEGLEKVQAVFVQTHDQLSQNLKASLEEAIKANGNLAKVTAITRENLFQCLDKGAKTMEELNSRHKELLEASLVQTKDFFEETLSQTKEQLASLFVNVGESIELSAKTSASNLEDIHKKAEQSLQDQSELLRKATLAHAKHIVHELNEATEAILKSETNFSENLIQRQSSLLSAFQDTMEQLRQNIEENSNHLTRDLDASSKLLGEVSRQNQDEFCRLKKQVTESLQTSQENYARAFLGMQENLAAQTTESCDFLQKTLASTSASLEAHLQGVLSNLTQVESRLSQSLEANLAKSQETAEKITYSMLQASKNLEGTLRDAQTSLTKTMQSLEESARSGTRSGDDENRFLDKLEKLAVHLRERNGQEGEEGEKEEEDQGHISLKEKKHDNMVKARIAQTASKKNGFLQKILPKKH